MVGGQSGFDLGFLIAVLPKALTWRETEPFAEQLGQTYIPNLHDVYKAMCDDHKHVDIVYTFANEALALYDDFDEQIFQKLNNQWQSCQLMLTTTGAAARGKERRPVLRPAVILFMLYSYTTCHLYQSHGPVPRVISKACMKFAI